MPRLSAAIVACLAALVTATAEPAVAQPRDHDRYRTCSWAATDDHKACIRRCDRETSRIRWSQCSNRCAQILRRCDHLRPPPRGPAPTAPR